VEEGGGLGGYSRFSGSQKALGSMGDMEDMEVSGGRAEGARLRGGAEVGDGGGSPWMRTGPGAFAAERSRRRRRRLSTSPSARSQPQKHRIRLQHHLRGLVQRLRLRDAWAGIPGGSRSSPTISPCGWRRGRRGPGARSLRGGPPLPAPRPFLGFFPLPPRLSPPLRRRVGRMLAGAASAS
jgi:hypothetical protein